MLQYESSKKPFPGPQKTRNSSTVDIQNLDLNKENDRYKTFEKSKYVLSNELAMFGYYFIFLPDTIKCQFCHVVQQISQVKDSVLGSHLKISPNCPLLRRRTTLNQPISADKLEGVLPPASYDVCGTGSIDETTQSFDVPASSRRRSRRVSRSESDIKYPEYKLNYDRVKTFDKWPRGIKQRPDELAEAGFFYSGKGDEIVCFSCGLGICQLEPDDNLWVEHKRLLINACSYLELNLELLKSNQIIYQEYIDSKKSQKVETELCNQLEQCNRLEDEATSSIESKCKVCLDRKANIVFLPCKHVAVCSQCVFGINNKCPICRGIIVEKILLFYA